MVTVFGMKDNVSLLENVIKTIELALEKYISYETYNFRIWNHWRCVCVRYGVCVSVCVYVYVCGICIHVGLWGDCVGCV